MKNTRKIYFLCPVNKKPAGGVKQIYRMVDALNKNGYEAYVVHKKKHREKWFSNDTQIKVNPFIFKKIKFFDSRKNGFLHKILLSFFKSFSFKINPEDIIVFPEIMGAHFDKVFDNQFVIFNQNCYYTFDHYKNTDSSPYLSAKNLATIVVSDDSKQYLENVFPSMAIHRINLGINQSIFNDSDAKKKQICYMPRKLENDVHQVLQILKYRGHLKDWNFVAIDNKNESEVAQIFRESAIFLSFNHREGFGLPPVEAMACGCHVIGYTGEAGKEYFKEEFSKAIEAGNILQFAQTIEKAAQEFTSSLEKGKSAHKYVFENYSFEKEEESILSTWNEIFKKI